MRLKVMIAAVLLAAAPASQGWAASESETHPIAAVFANAEYAPKLKDVQFSFGDQPHAAVAKSLGEVRTIRRTNGLGKDAETSCQRAFASALMNLSDAAKKKGGDAIINIHSKIGHQDSASSTEYLCAVGGVVVGMTLTGEIVKLQ